MKILKEGKRESTLARKPGRGAKTACKQEGKDVRTRKQWIWTRNMKYRYIP